jgi:hypothetical protein
VCEDALTYQANYAAYQDPGADEKCRSTGAWLISFGFFDKRLNQCGGDWLEGFPSDHSGIRMSSLSNIGLY